MSTRRLELGRLRSSRNKVTGKSHILGGEGQETDSKARFLLHGAKNGTEGKLETFTVSFKVDIIHTCNRNFRI